MGICIGGHLAFRAAHEPATSRRPPASTRPTSTSGTLGKGMNDNTLDRVGEIKGELLMIWGRQDPHVPREGRR